MNLDAALPALPRHSVRLRLTLLYGGLFLAAGTALLITTYVLVAHRLPTLVTATPPGASGQGVQIQSGAVVGTACSPGPAIAPSPAQFTRCALQARAYIANQKA